MGVGSEGRSMSGGKQIGVKRLPLGPNAKPGSLCNGSINGNGRIY